MSRRIRWVGTAVAAGLVGLAAGFVAFAATVAGYLPGALPPRADGIVVLTGGGLRLSASARLLEHNRGARLLISGVNPMASNRDLKRLSGLSDRLFATRVDVGYAAKTTTGNAEEAGAWARARGYKSLIVVTSCYHMPRSLTELGRVMPDVKLIPYSVVPRRFRARRWWTDAFTIRLLLAEYARFLPAAARYGMARALSWSAETVAAGPHAGR